MSEARILNKTFSGVGHLDWGVMSVKPEQTSQYKWDKRFIQLAHLVKGWSKDERKVGAVLVADRKVIGMGYNGFPRTVIDMPERYQNKELKRLLMVHAEQNAIFDVSDKAAMIGATLYATRFPCHACMAALAQNGIIRVASPSPEVDHPIWGESHKASVFIAHESSIELTEMN
ncbi:putative dCMP deaminase [Achromobacter phage vB_AxyS_19-32_Axy14]|nr:putative dCMP deaminase [Achromobacter phage vB_AxyS_19-32_Axy14]